jgi:uncharacterized damage-inducible protein DinB
MNAGDIYAYLGRARRDLWATLEATPDEVLSRPLLDGERFRSIKDLLFHVAAVEDGWLNEDIRRIPPVLDAFPALSATTGGPVYAPFSLRELLDYWHAVESSTLGYLAALTDSELARVVSVHDAPNERYTVDGLLSHVMFHEMRHTAQICTLLRMQGITPPSLDLLFYLPRR